ncbi:MAG TPA: lysyl oxidase family protein [Kofleriaceae bacterium]|jgi:hypothetical protein|nr:lysyl oxidase family protein [Kofleriaceae bacterium]
MRGWIACAAALAACGGNDEHVPERPIDAAIDAVPLDAATDATELDGPAALPDLSLDESRMAGTVLIQEQFFAAGACELLEGCIGAAGTRRLLRFSTVSANLGEGDVRMGPPEQNPAFAYSACHGHYHLTGFADYALVGPGGVVVGGHKQAFCLFDSIQLDGSKPSHGYDCGNQGISAGWADSYPRNLPCQWIDITDVPPGAYTLRVEVNPTGVIAETDRTNNILELPVAF